MSIGKRVSETFTKLINGDPEGAMFQICAAIDETATRESGKVKGTRSDYKAFLLSNIDIISGVGMGTMLSGLRVAYAHSNPDLPTDAAGTCSIEDIIYHTVRCGLYHTASLPQNIQFSKNQLGAGPNGVLLLPEALIGGLAFAVVASPVNASESSNYNHFVGINGRKFHTNEWWGRVAEFRKELLVELEKKRAGTNKTVIPHAVSGRLAGVQSKIDRANHHLNELAGLAGAFADGNQNCLVAEDDLQSGEKLYRIRFHTTIPRAFSHVIGDIVHNLRSSLDRLTWQLIEANGKTPGDKTSFPLTTGSYAFNRAITKTGVKNGVSALALNLIEAVQPYQSGYDALGALDLLSNFDTRRQMAVTVGIERTSVDISGGTVPTEPDNTHIGTFLTPNQLGGQAVLQDGDIFARIPPQFKEHVHPILVPAVAFREPQVVEGKTVVWFLSDMSQLVERVVQKFVSLI